MARLLSQQFADPVFAGEYGNLSVKAVHIVFPATATNADTVDLFVIPGKSRIHEWQLSAAASVGAATFALGWRYADGSAGGGAAVMIAPVAIAVGVPSLPLTNLNQVIDVDKDIIVYATVAGAVPIGRLDARAYYEFRGTL